MTFRPLHLMLPLLTFVLVQCNAEIPRQDCELREFSLSGQVLNGERQPVSGAVVRAFNEGSFEKPAFALSTTTAGDGSFHTDAVQSYACTRFTVEVTAPEYTAWSKTFYPLVWPWSETAYDVTVTLEAAAGAD